MQPRTQGLPVYQWSRPRPGRLWPAGWSSWASSAWTPCPPEIRLRSLWNPSPHSSGSRAPWTRFDCRHRPAERGLLITPRESWITKSGAPVMTLPQNHGHSCSWWGSGPWQPNQSVRCLLCGHNGRIYIQCSVEHRVTVRTRQYKSPTISSIVDIRTVETFFIENVFSTFNKHGVN